MTTPQTPTFPHMNHGPNAPDGMSARTPLSPRSQSRESERFSLLLEINTELMYEALVLQNTILEHKKEKDMINEATGEPMERELTGEEKPLHYDYSQ